MPTLICFALKEEAAPFRKIATSKVAAAQAVILLTGIGRRNAEKSVREFLLNWGARASGAHRQASRLPENARIETIHAAPATSALPELVLTCGFAGGLNPDLKLGEVVFEIFPGSSRGDEAQNEIGNRQSAIANQSEPPYVGCYEKLIGAGAKPAKFFCSDRIATTVTEKKKLHDETGADAVEMESEAIQAVCRECGIPCATVRVISDTASEDLPLDFNQLAKPDMSLDYGKLALAIAKSPGKIGALLRLQKKTKFAAEQLAAALSRIL